jgi:hypothetical protein
MAKNNFIEKYFREKLLDFYTKGLVSCQEFEKTCWEIEQTSQVFPISCRVCP